MSAALTLVCVLIAAQVADFTDDVADGGCRIELWCAECLPENMPRVTSHAGADGAVAVPHGAEVSLACGGGTFLAYPLRASLAAVCERGRYRVRHDGALRHLLELGCQEDVFEDVLHPVEHCSSPLQGRAYETQEGGTVRHLATVCFDADRAVAVRLRATNRDSVPLPPHRDAAAPLSLLGNFNHMFDAKTRHDAERLYSDDARMNRRLHELFKHERYTFAEQTLTSGKLLGGRYFGDQNTRASEFVSNRVAVWASVAGGNLRHLHRDVASFMQRSRGRVALDVYAGTHGVLTLNTGSPRPQVFLKAGGRFPVPRYIWTVLHAPEQNAGTAVVLLNDPFVTVSEIRDAVFCESTCGAVSWLPDLKRNRNYERPLYGLVFCCNLNDFANVVHEMPKMFNSTIQQLN